MKLNEYQDLAARTIPTEKDSQLRKAEFALALCEEAGETAGVLKKVIFHDHPMTVDKFEKFIEEAGDTLWHIAALATEYDVTLETIADYNLMKLQKRYKKGFTNEESINREE